MHHPKIRFISGAVYLLLLPALSTVATGNTCTPESVYVVRHVEKMMTPGERDPDLSPAGYAHARALDLELQAVTFDQIIATQFKRTQLTVTPIAERNNIDVTVRDARKISELAQEILAACGENIIVAGHSNTVPKLLQALGLALEVTLGGERLNPAPIVSLNEADYDSLFLVTYSASGKPKAKLLRF